MKCKIPSFVADFVSVEAWISDTNEVYTRNSQLDDGNLFNNTSVSVPKSLPLFSLNRAFDHLKTIKYVKVHKF